MTDNHDAEAHGGHGMQPYLVVFGALSIFTAVSFMAYEWTPRNVSFLIILIVAVVKAVLVGIYFMHLKQDWGKVFFMIIPCFILAMLLVVVLLPDIVLAWHY